MKKIFALILCLMLIAVPISAYAEGETEEINTEDILPEESPTPAPEGDTSKNWNEVKDTISGAFVKWVEPNIEEIGVVVTLIGYGIVLFKKLASVLKSLGIMNNNTITISKENANRMEQAMASIDAASNTVLAWDEKIAQILVAYQQTAEDKRRLEKELVEIKNYLKISAEATLAFSDEFCELLSLANIPNFRKEEIGQRHVAARNSIIEAEKKTEALLTAPEEVTVDDGEKQED